MNTPTTLSSANRLSLPVEGMTCALEPNCGVGHHLCNGGGTGVVGKSKGIELNSNSTQLMRADI